MPCPRRQLEALRYIARYLRAHGYAPSLLDVGLELRITKVTVFGHLRGLERRGLITRERHVTRCAVVTDAGHAALRAASPDGACPTCGATGGAEDDEQEDTA